MKQIIIRSVSAGCFFLALLLLANPLAAKSIKAPDDGEKTSWSAQVLKEAEMVYTQLDLSKKGLSKKAFLYGWKGFRLLQKKGVLRNTEVLSICDFSQSSRNKRLYIIDVANMTLLMNTYVAHGRNSGGEYASRFSNKPQSRQSSLGFYITRQTYTGEHGLSLKIDGLEKGFNDRANARHIVVHGSAYLGGTFLESNAFNGRSYGCPAVPEDQAEEIISTIKDGSCLFIYHPSRNYVAKSRIINA
jgi:hypothetical protein